MTPLAKMDIKVLEAASTPAVVDENVERAEVAEASATFDPAIVRTLKRKADLIIIPTLAITYLFK
jgi:hypothetical protein